jgi:hypothetical protein
MTQDVVLVEERLESELKGCGGGAPAPFTGPRARCFGWVALARTCNIQSRRLPPVADHGAA